jgi:hypothetical protein
MAKVPFYLVILLFFASCNTEKEAIPAYVILDSVSVNTLAGQGNNIHHIQAIQAFADGELLGNFELPATIPVHRNGKSSITIVPAVFLNGSKNQVVQHTSFQPADTMLVFTEGKTTTVTNMSLDFRTNAVFAWVEDFEDNSSTVVTAAKSPADSVFISTDTFSLDGRFKGKSKMLTAIISPSDTQKYIDLASFKNFENIPANGNDVFLEFDIRCDNNVNLALKRTNATTSEFVPYMVVFDTKGAWKRFYVNLVYETRSQPSDTKYQIYFSADFAPTTQVKVIQIDNIRLSYLN